MSAPTSLVSSLSYNTSTMTPTTAKADNNIDKIDLIEYKFNELAKKILDELKQSHHSKEFFQALDLIINEPQQQRMAKQSARLRLFISSTPDQATGGPGQQRNNKTIDRDEHLELKRKYEMLMEKQKQQQEQLDSHQQILFDNQYKSLPSEITGGRGVASQRKTNIEQTGEVKPQVATEQKLGNNLPSRPKNASADKLNLVLPGLNNQQRRQSPQQQPQRSAIPTSTILSGISQNNPLMKSATIGSFTPGEGTHLIRQSSLRLKLSSQDSCNQTQQQAKKDSELEDKPKTKTMLTPSEKIKQRRPTKATIIDSSNQQRLLNRLKSQEDDSDDENEDDNDEDDDDYEHEGLAARRAHLNQRFIQPVQQQQHHQRNQQSQQQSPKQRQLGNNSQVVKSKTFSDAKNHLSVSANVRQQQVASNAGDATTLAAPASRLSPVVATNQPQSQHQQRQRFQPSGSQLARSNTTAGATGGATLVGVTGQRSAPASQALVTSYKQKTQKQPQSINSREDNSDDDDDDFDDDDEDEQPRSINGLMSSNSGNMISGQLYKPHMNYSTSLLGNHRLSDDDEIIIIPTAQSPSSLIMSASQSPVNPQQSKQQVDEPMSGNLDEFNERFSISRTKSFWEKLANSKKSSGSGGGGGDAVGGQQQNSSLKAGDTNNNGNKMIHHQHSTVKSAFDRLDSTGGSGNSHYSGCSSNSSTSGDEQQNVFANRLARVSGGQALASRGQQRGASKQPAAMNPTINHLVQQDQLNRSDRFRQTR